MEEKEKYAFIEDGARVWWEDPEEGLSSGVYEVFGTEGEAVEDGSDIVRISDGLSEAEVLACELKPAAEEMKKDKI